MNFGEGVGSPVRRATPKDYVVVALGLPLWPVRARETNFGIKSRKSLVINKTCICDRDDFSTQSLSPPQIGTQYFDEDSR